MCQSAFYYCDKIPKIEGKGLYLFLKFQLVFAWSCCFDGNIVSMVAGVHGLPCVQQTKRVRKDPDSNIPHPRAHSHSPSFLLPFHKQYVWSCFSQQLHRLEARASHIQRDIPDLRAIGKQKAGKGILEAYPRQGQVA